MYNIFVLVSFFSKLKPRLFYVQYNNKKLLSLNSVYHVKGGCKLFGANYQYLNQIDNKMKSREVNVRVLILNIEAAFNNIFKEPLMQIVEDLFENNLKLALHDRLDLITLAAIHFIDINQCQNSLSKFDFKRGKEISELKIKVVAEPVHR